MKALVRNTLLTLTFLMAKIAFADSVQTSNLQLVSVNGSLTPDGSTYIGPYGIDVNETTATLFCLDANRDVAMNETWSATESTLSSRSPVADKEAAILVAAATNGRLDPVTGQLAVWAILDPSDAVTFGLPQGDLAYSAELMAIANSSEYSNSFYSQFTLYSAIPGTQSQGGTAQDFLGTSPESLRVVAPAPAPEPSSLLLLGTGLLSSAGMLLRRHRRSQ